MEVGVNPINARCTSLVGIAISKGQFIGITKPNNIGQSEQILEFPKCSFANVMSGYSGFICFTRVENVTLC